MEAFRTRQLATTLSDENLQRLHSRGLLRTSQLAFARDTRQRFGSGEEPVVAFVQQFTGAGKSGCIAMVCAGLLGAGPPRTAVRHRLLIVAPTTAALGRLQDTVATPTFYVRHLGMPEAEARELASRSGDWFVISTIQAAARRFASGLFRPDSFSELCVDEADFGAAPSGERRGLAWRQVREALEGRARILLLSATRGRLALEPYSRYGFADAQRDGVAKRLAVVWLVPRALDVDGRERPLQQLDERERSAARHSLELLASVAERGAEKLLEVRRATGVPWQMHVTVPRVSLLVQLLALLRRQAHRWKCPVTGRALAFAGAHGSAEEADRQVESFARFEADAILTCRLFERAADHPLLALTVNLRSFAGADALLQCAIGRGMRMPDVAQLRARHPRFEAFAAAPGLRDPVHTVIEHELAENRPHYLSWASGARVELHESVETRTVVFRLAQQPEPPPVVKPLPGDPMAAVLSDFRAEDACFEVKGVERPNAASAAVVSQLQRHALLQRVLLATRGDFSPANLVPDELRPAFHAIAESGDALLLPDGGIGRVVRSRDHPDRYRFVRAPGLRR